MKKRMVLAAVAVLGMLSVLLSLPVRQARAQVVFQAAGPTAESIQGTVDAFRAALGDPNNGNAAGPLTSGRREINWDGGGANDTTTAPVTPFDVFLNTRGAQFTTPGIGLSQAPPSGGAQGGLAGLFDNPTYGDIFSTFSPLRLFTPVGSRFTDGFFFVPGTNGAAPATVTAFGAVFTDVDQPNGDKSGRHSTRIDYFDADGRRLFTGFVPASPGDGSLSFFGIVFDDARIARVRITTGDSRPGPDDDKKDIVMMDDFIYGEPQPLP
jgi:type II secretory pathway pseudopilin PulG